MVTVETPGLLTTLQDQGRPGYAHLGIGRSGAADIPAMRLANALVGNSPDACTLEMTLIGPTLSFRRDGVIALTGAPLNDAHCDGKSVPMWQPVRVSAGSRLKTGAMTQGCRSYLAIGGGIDVAPWCGSRSTDVNARLGALTRPLAAADELPVGIPALSADAKIAGWSLDYRPWFFNASPTTIRLLRGSHTAALDDAAMNAMTAGVFSVGNDSNRVGIRLDGARLSFRDTPELISEGLVPGTIQLPPGGCPIIMGCEHPVTGGYPRIAQVAAVDLPVLAQCRPGDDVQFVWIESREAMALLSEREVGLRTLVAHINERLGTTA